MAHSRARLLYLVGEPGVGKTTLKQELTAGLGHEARGEPLPHTVWEAAEPVWEIGKERPEFGGTDALSMSIQPKVIEWLKQGLPTPNVLAEGDRLCNGKFFQAVLDLGIELTIAYLDVTPAEGARRRAARAAALGKEQQSDAWVQGRRTKVGNVVLAFAPNTVSLDAERTPADLARQLASCDPVAAVLRG